MNERDNYASQVGLRILVQEAWDRATEDERKDALVMAEKMIDAAGLQCKSCGLIVHKAPHACKAPLAMTDRVYIVVADTGEYGDRFERSICFYDSEEEANGHAAAANEIYRRLSRQDTSCGGGYRMTDEAGEALVESGLDPAPVCYWPGIEYKVEAVARGSR